MKVINPRPLTMGDTIGIVSPSSPIGSVSIDSGINYLYQKGFKLQFGKHINDRDRFLAGKDVDRANDIMDFFQDPKIKAIICTRGGQGSQRLLPLLDYNVISQNPKMLVGFSDTTALHLGLLKMTGLISYTGYTLTTSINSLVDRTLMSCLRNEPFSILEGQTVKPGIAEGALIGGNLSLLTSLLGTPYQPVFQGSILLIEDVRVEPYNADRMISQLLLAGVFEQVSGIIIGQFEQCNSEDRREGSIVEVINDWSSRFHVPCIKDFPYGHGEKKCVLPIGKNIILDATACSVTIS